MLESGTITAAQRSLHALNRLAFGPHENGNGGTDHGHGNVMWVMGGPVRGRRVYARWPGLAPAALYQERDVAVTTDFRDPIGQVLHAHLGLPPTQIEQIFPDHPRDSGNTAALIKV